MIDKHFGDFILVCDYCEEEAEEAFDSFQDAMDYKRKNDWKSIKTSKGWKDCCPECWDGE